MHSHLSGNLLGIVPWLSFLSPRTLQLAGAEGTASGLLQDADLGGNRGFPAICLRTWQALISQVPEVPSPKGGTLPRLTLIMEITVLFALLS